MKGWLDGIGVMDIFFIKLIFSTFVRYPICSYYVVIRKTVPTISWNKYVIENWLEM